MSNYDYLIRFFSLFSHKSLSLAFLPVDLRSYIKKETFTFNFIYFWLQNYGFRIVNFKIVWRVAEAPLLCCYNFISCLCKSFPKICIFKILILTNMSTTRLNNPKSTLSSRTQINTHADIKQRRNIFQTMLLR